MWIGTLVTIGETGEVVVSIVVEGKTPDGIGGWEIDFGIFSIQFSRRKDWKGLSTISRS
jgi:hypothetical protein